MFYEEKARQNHDIKIGNKSFKSVAKFKHLGTTLTNQIAFMRKLTADNSGGMPVTVQFGILIFPFAVQEYKY
jgi:hypothetical protein